MGKGIQVKGLDKLQKKLKENVSLDLVKRVVHDHGADLQTRMQNKADFTQGYQTGQIKRSIMLELGDDGLSVDIGSERSFAESHPNTEYAPYVEYGTRFMDAQPFGKPAYEEQKELFKRDLQKLMR